jgi:hypothetical protein
MCVRLATYRMTPLERSHLIELHDASEQLVARGDFHAYNAFNLEFHEGQYRATHTGFLAEQAIAVRARLNAFRRTQLRQGERLADPGMNMRLSGSPMRRVNVESRKVPEKEFEMRFCNSRLDTVSRPKRPKIRGIYEIAKLPLANF